MSNFEQRTEIVQDVIDRHIKYADKYVEALKKLNEQFPVEVVKKGSSRIYTTKQ